MWFGRDDRPLFGWLCAPDDGAARAVVVLCNPIGAECDNAQAAFDALTPRLVAAGVATFRFDYDGTGDSAGSWTDDDRLGSWLESVRAAVAFARSTGVAQVAVVGMRMGALLAVAALAGGPAVDALVLWDPSASGRRFLREQALLLSSAYGASQPDGAAAEGPATYYEPETATALSAFNPLGDVDPPSPSVLVLTREGRSAGDALTRMSAEGRVDAGTVRGQADLLDVPGICAVDDGDLDMVTGWLDGHLAPLRVDLRVDAPDRALIPAEGVRVAEAAVDLGDVPIFGIRCGPADEGRTEGPTAVFLSAGLLHRSGPARMWADLARRWAAAGITSVRVDLSGVGFSGTRPGQPRQVVLAPEAIDDLARIGEALGSPDSRDLVYVGLSAGGYLAVEAGLQLRPLGICPVNPSITSRPPAGGGTVSVRRRASRPMGFRRLRRRHKRIADYLTWAVAQVAVNRSPAGALVTSARRGSRVLAVVTGDEALPLRRNLFWDAVGWRVRRAGSYRVLVIASRDHSLYLRATREPAMDSMTEWMADLHATGRR